MQFDREKVPERVVHARGMVAKGYFEACIYITYLLGCLPVHMMSSTEMLIDVYHTGSCTTAFKAVATTRLLVYIYVSGSRSWWDER